MQTILHPLILNHGNTYVVPKGIITKKLMSINRNEYIINVEKFCNYWS